jgi:hypothetical protein
MKFWFPGSPEWSFTATLPSSFTPRAAYSRSRASGVSWRVKYTLAFITDYLLRLFVIPHIL